MGATRSRGSEGRVVGKQPAAGLGSSPLSRLPLNSGLLESGSGGGGQATGGGKKGKLLVVDDHMQYREGLREKLSDHGFEVTCAADGKEGWELFQRALNGGNPFNVVLTDMQMPGMDGNALAQSIKGDERSEDTPIILMSTVQPAFNLYYYAMLGKRVEVQDLVAVIRKAIKRETV